MANPPAKKKNNASAPAKGATKQYTGKSSPSRSGRPAGLFTWVAIGVVVIAVAAIVIVKVSNGSSKIAFGPTSDTVATQLTSVPATTFDTVGITSPVVATTPLSRTKGEAVLQWPDANGVKRPTVFYYGAEYCPFCAAARWPMIIALSRFGTWSGLYDMLSSPTDVYPNTPTFSFLHSTYSSKYINFSSVEIEDRAGKPLQTPTAQQQAVVAKFDPRGFLPFASFGNQALLQQASPLPSAFTGTSRDQIAAQLADPSKYLTQGIIASANYQTAAICQLTGQAPSAVCNSSGVQAAAKAMGY